MEPVPLGAKAIEYDLDTPVPVLTCGRRHLSEHFAKLCIVKFSLDAVFFLSLLFLVLPVDQALLVLKAHLFG
jgi:hypothetical protein